MTGDDFELDPEDVVTWGYLGAVLVGDSRLEEAEQVFRKAFTLVPKPAGIWAGLGVVLGFQNRINEAEEAYRQALEIEPDYAKAKYQLAWSLLGREDFQSADDIAKELPHEEEEAAGILATILAHRRDWNDAAIYARRFISTIANQDMDANWPHTVVFVRAAVRAGKAREAVEILEETGAAERWRPLREALEAIARGSESYLRRVAPEIRPAAGQLFRELQAPAPEEQARPRRGSSKKRRR